MTNVQGTKFKMPGKKTHMALFNVEQGMLNPEQ
jgi:hypothetical protein